MVVPNILLELEKPKLSTTPLANHTHTHPRARAHTHTHTHTHTQTHTHTLTPVLRLVKHNLQEINCFTDNIQNVEKQS